MTDADAAESLRVGMTALLLTKLPGAPEATVRSEAELVRASAELVSCAISEEDKELFPSHFRGGVADVRVETIHRRATEGARPPIVVSQKK